MRPRNPAQRLADLAHWALTHEERRHFAWMVSQAHLIERAADAACDQVVHRAYVLTLAQHGLGPQVGRDTPAWTIRHEATYRRWLTALLSRPDNHALALRRQLALRQTGLEAFAKRHGFRSARHLAAGLGLQDPTPSPAANER